MGAQCLAPGLIVVPLGSFGLIMVPQVSSGLIVVPLGSFGLIIVLQDIMVPKVPLG